MSKLKTILNFLLIFKNCKCRSTCCKSSCMVGEGIQEEEEVYTTHEIKKEIDDKGNITLFQEV